MSQTEPEQYVAQTTSKKLMELAYMVDTKSRSEASNVRSAPMAAAAAAGSIKA